MKTLTASLLVSLTVLAAAAPARAGDAVPAAKAPAGQPSGAKAAAQEVTLTGTLGCGKCSFHEAKACVNVLKVKVGDKVESYVLAHNDVSEANHEKVCGPSSPATVTGSIARKGGKKILTASAITFE